MKHQALFSSKVKSKKIKVSSAAILLVALKVNTTTVRLFSMMHMYIILHFVSFKSTSHSPLSRIICISDL